MGGSGIISWTICKSFVPHSRQITMPAAHHSIFTGQMLFLTSNRVEPLKTASPERQFWDNWGRFQQDVCMYVREFITGAPQAKSKSRQSTASVWWRNKPSLTSIWCDKELYRPLLIVDAGKVAVNNGMVWAEVECSQVSSHGPVVSQTHIYSQ